MPSWQSTSRIGCLINNPARRARSATPPARPQWTRVPLDFRPRWRYVVNKAGAANAAPALKYKFYFTPHFCGYTEFGIVPMFGLYDLAHCSYWVSSASNYILTSIHSSFLSKLCAFQNKEKRQCTFTWPLQNPAKYSTSTLCPILVLRSLTNFARRTGHIFFTI